MRRRISLFALLLFISLFLFWFFLPPEDQAWQRIQQRKIITFATDATFPPFAALDPNGNFYGFDVDLGDELARRLGVQAEYEAISYDGLLGAVIAQRDDVVLSAFVLQPERSKDVSYTPSYFNAGAVLVTPTDQPMATDLTNWAANKTLAAEYGSEGDALIRKWSRVTLGLKALPLKDVAEALRAVENSKADGAVVDVVSAYVYLSRRDDPTGRLYLRISTFIPEADAPYVMAVSAKSPILLRELNKALEEIKNDGTLSKLRVKWFGEAAK